MEEANAFFGLLTEHLLDMNRLEVVLQRDMEITPEMQERFREAQRRLEHFEPIQHILEETEFFSLEFLVNRDVLVPRPETEELVQWVLDDQAKAPEQRLELLEIGTGCGCIAVSLAKHLQEAAVTALDVSSRALEVARYNARTHQVPVRFLESDILQAEVLDREYQVIISNPPYVRELEKNAMHPNVLHYEPASALYVKDEDPLIFYRKITTLAKENLPVGGRLYFEINQYLGQETEALLQQEGFQTELRRDIFGNFRMLRGIK